MTWSEAELVSHARRAFLQSESIKIIAIDPVGSNYPEKPLIIHDPARTEKGQEGSLRPDYVISYSDYLILIQAKDEWNHDLDDDMDNLQRFLDDDSWYEALRLALSQRNEGIGELVFGAMLPTGTGYECDEEVLLFEIDQDGRVLVTTNSSELEGLADGLNTELC